MNIHDGKPETRHPVNEEAESGRSKQGQSNEKFCPVHPDAKDHQSIYRCSKFRALHYSEKVEVVNKAQLCLRCLRPHKTESCKADINCFKCGGNHLKTMHQLNSTDDAVSDSD